MNRPQDAVALSACTEELLDQDSSTRDAQVCSLVEDDGDAEAAIASLSNNYTSIVARWPDRDGQSA